MPDQDPITPAVDLIRKAWYSGRRIVPVVGAGLSVDAGIPIITSVVQYFGRFQEYLRRRAYLPRGEEGGPFAACSKEYTERPWRYAEDFGWPEPAQLQEDLLARLDAEEGDLADEHIEDAPRLGLDFVLDQQMKPGGLWKWEKLREAVERLFSTELTGDAARPFPPEVEALRRAVLARLERDGTSSVRFDLVGDWKKLIQHFTGYRADYADSLFARLCAGKGPGPSHRFLAFLVRLLAVNTILTFNFDDLIERSLGYEGISPKVFAMEDGRGLPHPALTRDEVCVLKLHGSTHALLLDERLDRPLTDEYLKRFDEMVGPDPLLLVLGCSGEDYRLRSLVERAVKGFDGKSVVWFHFEAGQPELLKRLGDRALAVPTNSPGAALRHLYASLAGRNPASSTSYVSSPRPPSLLADRDKHRYGVKERRFIITSLGAGAGGQCLLQSASQALAKEANGWLRSGYHVVLVDLESCYTLAEVVGSILDQCRQLDASLAPSVLPLDREGERLSAEARRVAVQRVRHALRRGRYFVAFDGLETYLWPPTSHHGETTLGRRGSGSRWDDLLDFLKELGRGAGGGAQGLGESRIALAVDHPKRRTPGGRATGAEDVKEEVDVEEGIQQLQLAWNAKVTPLPPSGQPGVEAPLEHEGGLLPTLRNVDRAAVRAPGARSSRKAWALFLLHLSCFRRTRTPVAMRSVLCPAFGWDEVTDLIRATEGMGLLWTLEDGSVWFHRPARDEVYLRCSEHTKRDSMGKLLKGEGDEDWSDNGLAGKAVAQLVLLVAAHQRVARAYYTDTFCQSWDCQAFLEYTYHRISCLRYLTKLLGVVEAAGKHSSGELALARGLSSVGALLREGWGDAEAFLADAELEPSSPLGTAILKHEPAPLLEPILESLGHRHAEVVTGLYRSWVRAEVLLRRQLPAEQLLRWADALLEDDLAHRCEHVVYDYDLESREPKRHPVSVSKKSRAALASFKEFLTSFKAKLLIERSDFDGCIALCRQSLEGKVAWGQLERFPEVPDRGRLEAGELHALLDVAVCRIKQAQEGEGVFGDIDAFLQRVGGLTGEGGEGPAAAAVADLHDARLRLHHLRCEVYLRDASVFSRGFDGRCRPAGVDLIKAKGQIREGIRRARYEDTRAAAHPRSAVLDPTADASLHAQYRSVFHMLEGRVAWLEALPDSAADAVAPDWEARFTAAFGAFERARGGIGDSNPLLSCLVELYAAEACLGRARLRLCPEDGIGVVDGAIDEAKAKYASAKMALQRARGFLQKGRRNVVWWRFFFLMVAQYHSDRITLGYARLLHREWRGPWDRAEARPPAGLPMYLTRMRRALDAVRNALDYHLPGASGRAPEWLRRVWGELSLSAYAVGRAGDAVKAYHAVAARPGGSRIPPGEFSGQRFSDVGVRKRLLETVRWLNERSRLVDSGLPDDSHWEWLELQAGEVDKQLEQHFTSDTGSALRLRGEILRSAGKVPDSQRL